MALSRCFVYQNALRVSCSAVVSDILHLIDISLCSRFWNLSITTAVFMKLLFVVVCSVGSSGLLSACAVPKRLLAPFYPALGGFNVHAMQCIFGYRFC